MGAVGRFPGGAQDIAGRLLGSSWKVAGGDWSVSGSWESLGVDGRQLQGQANGQILKLILAVLQEQRPSRERAETKPDNSQG